MTPLRVAENFSAVLERVRRGERPIIDGQAIAGWSRTPIAGAGEIAAQIDCQGAPGGLARDTGLINTRAWVFAQA